MEDHILLRKAFIYELPRKKTKMKGYTYDGEKGFWIVNSTKMPFVNHPNGPRPQSKKCDVETGEDQKGE